MKIALTSPYDFSRPSGVNNHIIGLAEQLSKLQHEVKIIAPSSQKYNSNNFFSTGKPFPLPSGGSIAYISINPFAISKTIKKIEQEKFEIIHLHEPFAGIIQPAIIKNSQAINIATFHSFNGTYIYKLGVSKFFKPYFKKLHSLIAVSQPAKNFINEYFPGKYEIIPNGINLGDYKNNKHQISKFQDSKTNILFVGRSDKRKGLKYIILAYGKLKWKYPDLRLLIVGPTKNQYREIINAQNLQDIHFIGQVSETDKIRYLNTADIFCSPATGNESFGYVILEAMSAQKPIVASKIEGYSSIIRDGHNGILTKPKDYDSIAKSIEILIKNQKLRTSISNNAIETANKYSWEKVTRKISNIYKNASKNL
ncbi:MAG: glycosyltransferase family 4 protein [SAR202 cluster bacterium]|nr:glycosyltransferase family 4 protein [SAR202 cluster bacterium]|tara:strand:- start:94135 stop:95235 length:1101 start_codon:yes stop_codon:yes gene_type:complete